MAFQWLINGRPLAEMFPSWRDSAHSILDKVLLHVARNCIVIGLFFLFYTKSFKSFRSWKVLDGFPSGQDYRREIFYGAQTLIIVASLFYFLMGWVSQRGLVEIYADPNKYGGTYYWVSFFILVLGMDAYFYMIHRLLHTDWLFRHVHYVHHLSKNTNPLTGISFHFFEAILLYSYPIWIIIPLHSNIVNYYAWVLIFFIEMGHAGIDFYPSFLHKKPWIFILNNPTHHALHHQFATKNYSLIFNWCDRLFKTNHPDYEARLEAFERKQQSS